MVNIKTTAKSTKTTATKSTTSVDSELGPKLRSRLTESTIDLVGCDLKQKRIRELLSTQDSINGPALEFSVSEIDG